MQEYPNHPYVAVPRGPITSLVLLVAFVVGGLFIGNFIGMGLALALLGGDLATLQGVVSGASDHPQAQNALLVYQAAAALCAFIAAPLAYLRFSEGRQLSSLSPGYPLWLAPALLTVLVVVRLHAFNALFIEWNREVGPAGLL
jgi:hypothetical protein